MGTKIKIQKGFVNPPVKYNKDINCKRSNNKQTVISLKFRALVIGNFRVKKILRKRDPHGWQGIVFAQYSPGFF